MVKCLVNNIKNKYLFLKKKILGANNENLKTQKLKFKKKKLKLKKKIEIIGFTMQKPFDLSIQSKIRHFFLIFNSKVGF
jgi:hypothetical protein